MPNAFVQECLAALICGLLLCAPSHAERQQTIDIPAGDLIAALESLSKQTNLNLVYQADEMRGLRTKGVKGNLTPQEAAARLLEGTSLRLSIDRETGAMMIYAANSDLRASNNTRTARTLRLVSAGPDETADTHLPGDDSETGGRDTAEMVVTGTNIRGAGSKASQVLVFDREEIQRSGFSSTHQFIQSLPQNFRGGSTEDTLGGLLGGEGANLNYGKASGANLRGLGNKATLTLLNGRRLAPVGVGEAVDLSMIPLSAIQRIDVLTDGASAIYGSDAVGGVINIVLRSRFRGAETSLRLGDTTSGSHEEYKLGQTFGGSWSSGGGLLAYEYVKRHSLGTSERKFTRNGTMVGGDIVPPNEQHSAVASLSQSLGARTELFAEALFSTRDTESSYVSSGIHVHTPVGSEQYAGGAGLRFTLGGDWQADAGANYSTNRMRYRQFLDGVPSSFVDMESGTTSFDIKADGSLLAGLGGPMRLAIGGQFRHEAFVSRGTTANTGGRESRDITAVFSELLIPLLGGERQLEVSVAARYENYSDFGSTLNPKVGLAWSPVPALNLRATYGTSFRAPSFYELSTRALPLRPIAYPLPDPLSSSPSGLTPTIVLYGNNDNLRPEQARNRAAGVDFRPEVLPGLSISLTYFDIDFTDRIAEPLTSGFFDMLINEAQHPQFIDRTSDPAVVAGLMAQPNFINLTGMPLVPGDIGVIADNRRVNVSSVEESGMDFSLGYDLPVGVDRFSFQLSGTFLFEKYNRVTPASPLVRAFNTVFTPADLKLRNRLGWTRNGFSASLFINYVDNYRDVRPGWEGPVSSWTTVDLTMRYRFSDGWTKGMTLSLSALNLMDEDPPFVRNNGFDFDATNASGVGRYVSIGVSKEW